MSTYSRLMLGVILSLALSAVDASESVPASWSTAKVVDMPRLRVSVSKPALVSRSQGRLWFPTLVCLGNGELVAIMSDGHDTTANRPGAKFFWSADGGWSWSEPKPGMDVGSALRLPNGDCLLLPVYLASGSNGLTGAYQVIPKGTREILLSAGGDFVVSGLPRRPTTVDMADKRACFGFTGQTVLLKDGRYLATLYGHYVGDASYSLSLVTVASKDGRTWTYLSTIATPAIIPRGGGEGPSEAALCRLKNGRLMSIFRISSGTPYGQAWSEDEGKTWTKPYVDANGDPLLSMKDRRIRSVQPSLAVLEGGLTALSGGRPGVSVWINKRGDGKDWDPIDLSANHNACVPAEPHVITSGDFQKHTTSGYSEVVALDDRHLLVIYDRQRAGGRNAPDTPSQSNSVWVVRLTVETK